MSEDQMKSLAARSGPGTDVGERLKKAKNADEVVEVLKSAGVHTTKAELIKSEARKLLNLSDSELESVQFFSSYTTDTLAGCATWVFGCCG